MASRGNELVIGKLKSHNLLNLIVLLILSAGISVALVIFRIWYTKSLVFAFFFWNLWLALIPFGIGMGLTITCAAQAP